MRNTRFQDVFGHPEHGFGFRPDPEGRYRYNAFCKHPAALKLSLPPATNNIIHVPPVWCQGRTGSCGGHGTAGMITTAFAARGKPLPASASPSNIYRLSRAVDRANPRTPLQDTGTWPNSIVRALSVWGCTLENEIEGARSATAPDYVQWLEAHVNDEPKLGELERSNRRILVGFNAIPDRDLGQKETQFQQALASGYPVGVGVAAGNDAFQNYDGSRGPLGFTGSAPDHWIFVFDYSTVGELRQTAQYPDAWFGSLDEGDTLYHIQNSWGIGSWTPDGRAWVTPAFIIHGCFNSLIANLGA